jgi:plastocyanin
MFAACGGGGDSGAAKSDAPPAEPTTVTMKLVAYQPEKLTVDAGTKVTWKQTDPGAHTVTSGTVEQGGAGVTQQPDDRFDSGNIATGDTYEFTFDEAGAYPYFCRLHPATMRGEIQVR